MDLTGIEKEVLFESSSYGSLGVFHLKIEVGATKLPNLRKESINKAMYGAVDMLSAEIQAAIKEDDPGTIKEAERNFKLIDVFDEPIYVEEIPNRYCKDWCCRHLPWFVVTTKVGRFTIGWRKRVIHIDWEDTTGTDTADNLFKDEDTTKGGKYIHAWSISDAKRYVSDVIDTAAI